MDKTKWPQAWKDQYNEQLRLRRVQDRLQKVTQVLKERAEFPRIWQLRISEDNLFPLIAYEFPLHRVLCNLLQRFIQPGQEQELTLSSLYLYNTQKICPAFYSDRERAVVILNRFKNSEEWEELFHWLSFFSQKGHHPHMHFMLGVLFLDKYLRQTDKDIFLKQSILHLQKVENWVGREDTRKALSSIQALAFHLNRDFDQALGYLGIRKKKTFEEDFADLIDRFAA